MEEREKQDLTSGEKDSIFVNSFSNSKIQIIDDDNENNENESIKESVIESIDESLKNNQENEIQPETINEIKTEQIDEVKPELLSEKPIETLNEQISEVPIETLNVSNEINENNYDNRIVEKSNEEVENGFINSYPNNSVKHKKYVSYETRVLRYSIMFIVTFAVGIILLFQSFVVKNEEYINYTEKSNLDYKVFLKENDFYEEKYLDKNMLYVASLIDYIDIDFLYNFNIDEKVDLDFDYNISAVLSIQDAAGKKTYLTKDYELLENKSFSLNGKQDYTITEHISLDYDKYNKLASTFKSTYALDTTSKLSIYLNIDKKSNDESIKDMASKSDMLIELPLSEKSISIQMDYKDINNNSSLVKEKSITISNYIYIIVSCVLLVLSIYALISLLKLFGLLSPKKSKYDKYINKIMRQYDRLIVKHYTCPDLKKYDIVKIREFNELLDMRDNLKLPIMYYSVTEHQKSYFYIVNYNNLYLLVIKAADFDK